MVNWRKVAGAALVAVGMTAILFGIFVGSMQPSEHPPKPDTDNTLFGAVVAILGLVMVFAGLYLLFSNPAREKGKGV